MTKIIAIISVITWSGFWAFGYLALTAQGYSEPQLVTASLLIATGLITGTIAYLRLAHAAEVGSHVQKTKQLDAAVLNNRTHAKGSI